jgi:hypothetical protein
MQAEKPESTFVSRARPVSLRPRNSGGGQVQEIELGCWRLSLPGGPAGQYRWAQLDDYLEHSRRDFEWNVPFRLELEARVSGPEIPGTWGFGFWNDPFNFSFNLGGAVRRLPALPNAAWFFNAPPPNFLALHDHPGEGLLAAAFCAPRIPAGLLAPVALALPLVLVRPGVRLLRRMAGWIVSDDASRVDLDPTVWRRYRLECASGGTRFFVDDQKVFATGLVPRGPLGLVIWIDNQYAALHPDGRIGYGTLPVSEEVWLEVRGIRMETGINGSGPRTATIDG